MMANETAVAIIGTKTDAVLAELAENSFAARLCDSLIEDLADLTTLCKAVGEEQLRHGSSASRVALCWQTNEPWKGTYVGLGLGEGWLNFGQFANPVIVALRQRFAQGKIAHEFQNGEPYDTMLGTYCANGELYHTAEGTFWLDHTYAWFVHKRVD
jgi:hypothetical protein